MKKSKGSAGLIILIIVLVMITLAAIIFALYFWQRNVRLEAELNASKTSEQESSEVSQPVESPRQVVENFMKYTLGTLPDAEINYQLAKNYLTDSLKAQNSSESWVSQFYGIQDGPTSVKFISQNISGDSATLRYDPSWGEMSLGWAFSLTKIDNEWKISQFRNDAQ